VIGLAILLLVVISVRFDRRAVLPPGALWQDGPAEVSDARNYCAYVSFFRGVGSRREVGTPFLYRPLLPLLAAPLPLSPMTALDVLNVVFLELALFLLLGQLAARGFGLRERWAGGALFVVSFPTFYYGAAGLVDPAAILALAGGATAAGRRRWLATGLVLTVGSLAKETTLILLPVAATILWCDEGSRAARKLATFAGLLLCFAVPFVALRIANRDVGMHLWLADIWRVRYNLRPRALASVVLTFGLVGTLAAYATAKHRSIIATRGRAFFWPNLVGCIGGAALLAWSFVSARTDGRPLWMAYPFAIPLGVAAIEQIRRDLRPQGGSVGRARGTRSERRSESRQRSGPKRIGKYVRSRTHGTRLRGDATTLFGGCLPRRCDRRRGGTGMQRGGRRARGHARCVRSGGERGAGRGPAARGGGGGSGGVFRGGVFRDGCAGRAGGATATAHVYSAELRGSVLRRAVRVADLQGLRRGNAFLPVQAGCPPI
jgi:hypothetical protein